jgi:hypothetical protein
MSNRWPGGLIRKTPVTPAGPFQNGAAPGMWTLAEASFWTKQGLWPIAGNAQLFVEDVFSTTLYTGNGATQTITNGINLSGQGGLVWIKGRSEVSEHGLYDTVRGLKVLSSNNNSFQYNLAAGTELTAFNSNGFSIGTNYYVNINTNGQTYASWTFREAPNFFDVVTWTGNGANRNIAHNLGSVPGMILVKRTDDIGNWQVYHRSNANTQYMVLNSTAAVATGATRWNSTTPTSTEFTVGTDATVNASGGTYVAYLFAHNTTSDGFIQCGSVTGTSGTDAVSLGWEPQWLLIRSATSAANWKLVDNMRGFPGTSTADTARLFANSTNAESSSTGEITVNPTGFQGNGNFNTGETYIYVAIRRGPMRTPTLGTSVFNAQANLLTDANKITTGFVTDWFWERGAYDSPGVSSFQCSQRLTQTALTFTSTAAEGGPYGAGYLMFDYNDGFLSNLSGNINPGLMYGFRRAPGFMDVVCLNSTTSAAQVIQHNLGVAPQIIISKRRNGTSSWQTMDATNYLRLNTDQADLGVPIYHTFTSTSFSIDAGACSSGENWVFYLFASAPGVSKVGTYTGNGSSQTINCAFTTGARFVLIKRTDSTGDWYVWDSARGIVAGNDPYLALNTTAAQVTSNDSVDTDNTGFVVNQVAASNINVNAATYIFLAIA